MKTIARLVVREGGDKDGLILGVKMKGTEDILIPGHVYELREILGEVLLVDVGKSCIPRLQNDIEEGQMVGGCCWGNEVSRILDYDRTFLLTREEYMQTMKKEG